MITSFDMCFFAAKISFGWTLPCSCLTFIVIWCCSCASTSLSSLRIKGNDERWDKSLIFSIYRRSCVKIKYFHSKVGNSRNPKCLWICAKASRLIFHHVMMGKIHINRLWLHPGFYEGSLAKLFQVSVSIILSSLYQGSVDSTLSIQYSTHCPRDVFLVMD